MANLFPQYYEVLATLNSEESPVKVRVGDAYQLLLAGNFVHPPTVLMRRNAFERVGYYDQTLRYSCDYDQTIRICRLGGFAYVDAPLLRYRRSETQMSNAWANGVIPLETAQVLEKVRRDDPAVYTANRALFEARFSGACIEAAGMIGATDRTRALGLLARGLRHRFAFASGARALAKILIPRSVVVAVKGSMGQFTHARPAGR
jgi:hypothetical protein